jgi:hypothetical protein
MDSSNLSDVGKLFGEFSELVIEFDRAVGRLCRVVSLCGVSLPDGDDWYELLSRKLSPQIGERAYLIVSVMGGTNTGKSMIFNHLVGDYCSGVDYRASGTKHPVCVVSGDISDPLFVLRRNFCNFNFVEWLKSDQSLDGVSEHRLFWRSDDKLSDRLLILDTPDVDSDNDLNWSRARAVRHASDVVIAVLTGQKYNDATVRRFFREAAEASKPLIVIFNMVDFERDVEHIPIWLNQFCEETHSVPISTIVIPFDEKKSASLRLPFYQLTRDGVLTGETIDLRRMLTELHFERIKLQTLRGAIRVIMDDTSGLPSFLRRIEFASRQFGEALDAVERSDGKTKIEWPAIPISILADEMRMWWNEEKRPAWSRRINDVYRRIGVKLTYPFRKLRGIIVRKLFMQDVGGVVQDDDLLQYFRKLERGVVLTFIESIFNRLEILSRTDNLVLRREMLALTSGVKRVEILKRAEETLDELEPIDKSFREVFRRNLTEWSERNPVKTNLFRTVDRVLTVMRPMVTVSLVVSGFVIGSVVVIPWVGVNVIGGLAAVGGVVVGGEAIIYTASEGIKVNLARLFRRVQEEFTVFRSRSFHIKFLGELWGGVVSRLRTGSMVSSSSEFKDCQDCLKKAAQKITDVES